MAPAGGSLAARRRGNAVNGAMRRMSQRWNLSTRTSIFNDMTYAVKPKFHHPSLPKNALGFTHRDYEGAISTLCAGCGHDSISASIIEACFELSIEPHRVA